jgi:hypothetical protein
MILLTVSLAIAVQAVSRARPKDVCDRWFFTDYQSHNEFYYEIANAVFDGCLQDYGDGGAVYSNQYCFLRFSVVLFTACRASGSGGAFHGQNMWSFEFVDSRGSGCDCLVRLSFGPRLHRHAEIEGIAASCNLHHNPTWTGAVQHQLVGPTSRASHGDFAVKAVIDNFCLLRPGDRLGIMTILANDPNPLVTLYQEIQALPKLDVSYPRTDRDAMIDEFERLHDLIDSLRASPHLQQLTDLEAQLGPVPDDL